MDNLYIKDIGVLLDTSCIRITKLGRFRGHVKVPENHFIVNIPVGELRILFPDFSGKFRWEQGYNTVEFMFYGPTSIKSLNTWKNELMDRINALEFTSVPCEEWEECA